MGLGLDLLPIVQALAAADPVYHDGSGLCTLCDARDGHAEECPWVQARAELAPLERAVGEAAECGSCRAPINWIVTKAGKRMPVDPRRLNVTTAEGVTVSGFTSHFATCPRAHEHRRKR